MTCPAGHQAGAVIGGAKTNTENCKPCSAGTYSAGADATTCTACAAGLASADVASVCVSDCAVG